jgi:hypothetical protein
MKRIITAACAAATLALAIPAVQSFAATDEPTAAQQEQGQQRGDLWRQRRAEVFDARLVGFKASLALTSDQEKASAPFELALRDAAKRGPWPGREADEDRGASPSPIDRMKAISQRLGERATKLSALADAAAPLYTSLDDRQKVVFDATLRGLLRPHHGGPGGPDGRRWDRRD